MSTGGRSKKRSSRARTGSREKAVDRPFEPGILREANRIARSYSLVIEPDESVGFIGRSLELPLVMADGSTVEACIEAVREATVSAVATMLEVGDSPPVAGEVKRTEQVNVRLTVMERRQLEHAARDAGFRSISDFIRTASLRQAS